MTEYNVTNILGTQPLKNMIMGKVDTSNLMMITWAMDISFQSPKLKWSSWTHTTPYILTHHGPVPHICVAILSAYFRSAPDMWRWFQCSFPQCLIHGAWQTARSSPVPQIVVARPHLLSHQRPIYVARHRPLSLHVLCGKYQMLSPIYWLFFPITVFHKV